MAFPEGWGVLAVDGINGPFPLPGGIRPRFARVVGVSLAAFDTAGAAILYKDVPGIDPIPRTKPQDQAAHIVLTNWYLVNSGAGIIEVSFDGVNVHEEIASGGAAFYNNFPHAGIALRIKAASVASAFTLTAY